MHNCKEKCVLFLFRTRYTDECNYVIPPDISTFIWKKYSSYLIMHIRNNAYLWSIYMIGVCIRSCIKIGNICFEHYLYIHTLYILNIKFKHTKMKTVYCVLIRIYYKWLKTNNIYKYQKITLMFIFSSKNLFYWHQKFIL